MLMKAGPHMSLAREGQHVRLLPLFEEHTKLPGVAVHGVGHHPRYFDTRIQSPPEHLFGQFGLGMHPNLFWYSSLFASLPIFGPLLGQIQLAVYESLPPTGGVSQEHPNLAVLRLAGGARVLALYPDTVDALLQEARLVHHEQRLLIAE